MTIDASWTLDSLIEAYKEHQRRTRGLREPTLRGYEWNVRLFVRAALGDDPINPARLGRADVLGFIASMSDGLSPGSMGTVRTALRSFFRYLRVEALCDNPLEAAVPTIAQWRLSSIPRFLSDQQLEQVLASLDTCRPYGLRERAIVSCLAKLGLRPSEVANLRLDDIDWRAGTVELRQRLRSLPGRPHSRGYGQALTQAQAEAPEAHSSGAAPDRFGSGQRRRSQPTRCGSAQPHYATGLLVLLRRLAARR